MPFRRLSAEVSHPPRDSCHLSRLMHAYVYRIRYVIFRDLTGPIYNLYIYIWTMRIQGVPSKFLYMSPRSFRVQIAWVKTTRHAYAALGMNTLHACAVGYEVSRSSLFRQEAAMQDFYSVAMVRAAHAFTQSRHMNMHVPAHGRGCCASTIRFLLGILYTGL